MAYSIRVSLPGYNALTDTNPDHFALKSDLNDILIKEYTRGTITVQEYTPVTINHNLGYIPFYITFYQRTYQPDKKYYSSGSLNGVVDYGVTIYSDTNQLIINTIYFPIIVYYYIFYDNII